MTVRDGFIGMDDRLWTPEEWAVWLKYVESHNMCGESVDILRKDRCNETSVIEQKDSRFVKNDTET